MTRGALRLVWLGGAAVALGCVAPDGPSAPARPAMTAPARTPTPPATVQAVAAFEREVVSLVASGGDGDTAALRAAWRNIFTSCTMQGEAHERLHAFLVPMMPSVAQIDTTAGATRLASLRAMQRQLARFDERFVAAP